MAISAELRQRLADLAQIERDARATLATHRHRLQDAVVEALDVHGATTSEVGHAIGVTRTRVHAITVQAYTRG